MPYSENEIHRMQSKQAFIAGCTGASERTVSSSVAAGEPLQRKPMTLRAPLSMSPSIAGKLLLAGKYAMKFGDCQCVSPARSLAIFGIVTWFDMHRRQLPQPHPFGDKGLTSSATLLTSPRAQQARSV